MPKLAPNAKLANKQRNKQSVELLPALQRDVLPLIAVRRQTVLLPAVHLPAVHLPAVRLLAHQQVAKRRHVPLRIVPHQIARPMPEGA